MPAGTYYVFSYSSTFSEGDITTSITVDSSTTLKRHEDISFGDLAFHKTTDSVLANLDKSGVTTGVLYPRALPISDLESDSKLPYDAPLMKLAYKEIFYSSYDNSSMMVPSDLFDVEDAIGNSTSSILNIINYDINVIDTLAVQKGLLTIKKGLLYDVPGRASSPFLLKHVVIASPNTTTIYGSKFQLKINNFGLSESSSKHVASVSCYSQAVGYGTPIAKVYISSDSHKGSPDSGDWIGVGYDYSMVDTIRVVLTYKDNSTDTTSFPMAIIYSGNPSVLSFQAMSKSSGRSGHAHILTSSEIIAPSNNVGIATKSVQGTTAVTKKISAQVTTLLDKYVTKIDDSISITSSLKFQGIGADETVPSSGIGKADIFYAAGNTNHELRKPIILINGFDPTEKRIGLNIYNVTASYLDANGQTKYLGNDLRNAGYDLVILTFPDYKTKSRIIGRPRGTITTMTTKTYGHGGDYLERNAYVLIDLINICNTRLKASGSSEKLVVIGPSMGGLISRYALAYMEKNKMNHNTRLWVSFDSPHLGANVPIGSQTMLDYATQYVGSPDAKIARDYVIGCPAAQEMLMDYYSANPSLSSSQAYPSPLRATFLQALSNVGDFPTQLRKVAICNGSQQGNKQFDNSGKVRQTPCETMLDIHFRKRTTLGIASFIFGVFKGNPQWNGDITTFKTSVIGQNGQPCEVFSGTNPGPWNGNYTNYRRLSASAGPTSVDICPGGNTTITGDLGTEFNHAIKGWIPSHILAKSTIFTDDSVQTFIPLVSALALTGVSDFGEKLANQNLICSQRTPFAAYFAPDENEPHVNVNVKNVAFLMPELAGDTSGTSGIGVYRSQGTSGDGGYKISGPTSFCKTFAGSFTISPVTTQKLNWTTSSDITIISGNGTNTIQVKGNGDSSNNSFIQAAIPSLCGDYIVKQLLIQPRLNAIDVQTNGPCITGSSYQDLTLNAVPNFRNASNWQWTVDNPATLNCIFSSPNSSQTQARVSGGGGVTVTYADSCGFSHKDGVTIYSSCSTSAMTASVYPNPSNSLINVDFKPRVKTAYSQTMNSRVSIIIPETVQLFNTNSTNAIYTVKRREIIAHNNRAIFNVTGLKAGFYFIHSNYLDHQEQGTIQIY